MEQENVQTNVEAKAEATKTNVENVENNVEEKKYTDKQLNDISLKNEQKAINKLLKELGIDDKEKAKSILAKAREEEAAKSVDEKSLELQKEKEKAQLEAINSRIENAMLRKGIKDEKVERAVRIVDKKNILDEKGQLDQGKLNAELEELLKVFPELIEKAQDEKIGFKIGADGKQDKPEDEMQKMRKIMGLK